MGVYKRSKKRAIASLSVDILRLGVVLVVKNIIISNSDCIDIILTIRNYA
jgi:hypothetical protein